MKQQAANMVRLITDWLIPSESDLDAYRQALGLDSEEMEPVPPTTLLCCCDSCVSSRFLMQREVSL